LPSVKPKTECQKKHSAKSFFAECLALDKHSAKKLFAEYFLVALGMPKKLRSAKSRFPVAQHVITQLTSN
jgi:hypothetical protein